METYGNENTYAGEQYAGNKKGDIATVAGLKSRLNFMYWEAAKREVCNMILFYKKDLLEVFHEKSPYEAELGALTMKGFKKLFKLWSAGQNRPKDFSDKNLYATTREMAQKHYNFDDVDIDEATKNKLLRARHLLQAAGKLKRSISGSFLDLDLIYDHTIQFAPSYQQHLPKVECIRSNRNREVFRALRCGLCHLLIRSPVYDECALDFPCRDRTSATMPVGMRKLGRKTVQKWPSGTISNLPQAIFRLCPLCTPKLDQESPCARAHLKRMQAADLLVDNKADLSCFLNDVNRAEDMAWQKEKNHDKLTRVLIGLLKSGSVEGLGIQTSPLGLSNKIQQALEWFSTLSTPAGIFHVSLIFGPLMIENGVGSRGKHQSFGGLVSPRALPPLCFDHKDVTARIDHPESRPNGFYKTECLSVYRHKDEHIVYIIPEAQEVGESGDRNTVAAVKRVYGGLFSGSNKWLKDQELSVLKTFIKAAERCKLGENMKIAKQRQEVLKAADKVMEELRRLLSHEVGLHLQRLAEKLLAPSTILKWHPRTNSCQQFVDVLLSGEDFEHLFPLFPGEFVHDEALRRSPSFPWPRYLISFNDRIDGLSAVGFQSKSIVSKFCQAKRDRCDIVEFAEIVLHAADVKRARNDRKKRGKLYKNIAKGVKAISTTFGDLETTATLDRSVYNELLLGFSRTDDCSISEGLVDALWDLPRDTMSLIQFNILRPSTKYRTINNEQLTRRDWVINRLALFRQLDLFASHAGGFGAALVDVVTRHPEALHNLCIPHARIYGTAHVSDRVRYLNFFHTPAYVVMDVAEQIEAFLEKLAVMQTQKFKSGFQSIKAWCKLMGGVIWVTLTAFLKIMGSTLALMSKFQPNDPAALLDFFGAACNVLRTGTDTNGWRLMKVEGLLVVTHARKRMRSLR